MATIRTQTRSGKFGILTKTIGGQKRVSCSCCAGEPLCLYPADSFIYDELPSEIGGLQLLNPLEPAGEFVVYYGNRDIFVFFSGEAIVLSNEGWRLALDFTISFPFECLDDLIEILG